MPRGSFWYDKISGAWGVEGGPTGGFTAPGIDLGGPLGSDASRGNTGGYIGGDGQTSYFVGPSIGCSVMIGE